MGLDDGHTEKRSWAGFMEGLGAKRLEFRHLLLGLEVDLLLGGELVLRCDPEDVAGLPHAEPLAETGFVRTLRSC